jgi:hypothetical protein
MSSGQEEFRAAARQEITELATLVINRLETVAVETVEELTDELRTIFTEVADKFGGSDSGEEGDPIEVDEE